MKREIRVEERHIEQGSRWNPMFCPVALSLKEAYPDYKSFELKKGMIRVHVDDCIIMQMKIPKKIRRFIRGYDREGEAYPFTFFLDLSQTERL